MSAKQRLLFAIPALVIALVLVNALQSFLEPQQVSMVLNVAIGVIAAGALIYVFLSGRRMSSAVTTARQPSVGFTSVGLPQLWRQLEPLLSEGFARPRIESGRFYLSITAKTLAVCADDEELTDLVVLPTTDLYSIDLDTATETSSGQLGAGRPAIAFSFLRENSDSDIVLTIAVLEGQDPGELLERLRAVLTTAR